MAADISVGIGVLGETEFKKALTACQNTLKQLDSSLKANAAEFEANAGAMGDNAERAQILKRTLEEQRKLEKALGEAVEFAAGEYGEASTQTTKYVVAQNRAREAIARIEKQLADTDREMEEFGRDSAKVARQIDSGITEAAEDASRSIGDMVEAIKTDMGSIRSNTTISAIADIGDGIVDMATGLSDFAEGTRDMRRQLAQLQTNAVIAGKSYDEVYSIALKMASITGDLGASIEATSALLKTGFDPSEMLIATDALIGAAIAWPETFKVENIAESLQESISAGGATGAFAELIEKTMQDTGLTVEDFENAMKAAGEDLEKRQTVALGFLNATGTSQHTTMYAAMNADLIAAEEATLKLDTAIAKLGRTFDIWATPIKNDIAEIVEGLDEFLKVTTEHGLTQGLRNLGNSIETEGMFQFDDMLKGVLDIIENKEKIPDYIGEAVDYLKKNHYIDWVTSLWQKDELKEIEIPAGFGTQAETGSEPRNVETLIDKIKAEYKKAKEEIAGEEEGLRGDIAEGLISIDPSVMREQADALLDEYIAAIESGENKHALEINAQREELLRQIAETEKLMMNQTTNTVTDEGAIAEDAALLSGTNIGSALASGLSTGCAEAESVASQTVAAINATWAQLQTPVIPSFGGQYAGAGIGGGVGSGLGSYTVNMSIDGKRFATATSGYMSLAQAQHVSRLARLNA